MKIIDSEKLEDFIKKHADANNAIEKWVASNPQLSSSASFLRLNVLSSLN